MKIDNGLAAISNNFSEEVTGLKRELNQLKQELAGYRSLLEDLPQIVWEAEANGNIIYFNRHWAEYTGTIIAQKYSSEEFLAAIHPENRANFRWEWQEAVKKQQEYQTSLQLQRGDGHYRTFSLSVKPIFRAKDRVERWIGILTEICAVEPKLQTQIAEIEERWQLALEGIGDGIFDWDITSGEAFMSPVLKAMLGYKDWQVANTYHGWRALVHPEDLEGVERELLAHVDRKKPLYQVEYRLRCKDGNYKWILARGKAKWDETGKAIRMVGSHCDISDRKQAEIMLQKSEAKYRLLAENATDLISIQTPERIYQYVSPACYNLLGYQPEELIAQSIYQFFHPEDATALQKTYAIVGKFPDKITHRYRLRRCDGEYIWIEATDRTIYEEDGFTIAKIISTLRDISDRVSTEREVIALNSELEDRVEQRTAELEAANQYKDKLLAWEQEARKKIQLYADIINNIQLGFCVWKLENLEDITSFRLVTANPAASELLSIDLENYIGKKMIECFPRVIAGEARYLQAYAEVVRSQTPKAFNEIHYSDDRLIGGIYAVKAIPLPDNCLGIGFEDISDRKQIEKALVETNRQYTNVVSNVREVIFQTDTKGNLTFLNSAWSKTTGFDRVESLGRPLRDYLYRQTDKQHAAKIINSLVAGEKQSWQGEFRLETKKGKKRWLEIKFQLDRDSEGQVLGTVGTIDDITKRKNAEIIVETRAAELAKLNQTLIATTQELEKRNQELDRFAYAVSHDLKEPLRAIGNLSQWLREDLHHKLDDNTARQLDLLQARVERMQVFIDALLQYSRLGRHNNLPEMVRVEELLAEIIDSLAPPAEFKIEIDGNMPAFVTERLPLQQVFFNLISNGIKHHHRRDGVIKISVCDRGEFYQFSVADNGPGIDPIYHEKIFTIFKTIDDNRNSQNTGIGLSIVKKNLENYGGTIAIESAIDRGTTFKFTWPKRRSSQQ